MLKLATVLLAVPVMASAAQLTDMETRWLQAGASVLAYAKGPLQLPIDIVVQPQAAPGAVPLAMGFDGGRCKLVFSMRGNDTAEQVLNGVPQERQALMIEAMTAHEVGHCWRHAQGSWHSVPVGFQEPAADPAASTDILQMTQQLRDTRREEGYADLAALAWIQQRRPADYAAVYQWLHQVRAAQPDTHISHDTQAWLQLAADGRVLSGNAPFEQAKALWNKAMLAAD
ncbi:hypothetical protein GCM10027277_21360 [Pseudoduganella ginsengisoli]|uniref:Uncharacterized protein n=1 Tax=Pseudoduganella ginsengisoli TaxID=1462440 RepID=A0A6L6PSX6_9BURK|nr:hypothetical protein [Pseudoduganella ginsengisoli]MTW00610.1 hypothetical protein [Pseudoduganella ginsengisoli]